MTLSFTKMNGAGNDFVVVDNRALQYSWTREVVAHLCDRHRGVGADGLLAVEPAADAGVDFTMRYFNSDGGEAEMCGNGARCFARFAAGLFPVPPSQVRFQTLAGPIGAALLSDGTVELAMSDPHSYAAPVSLDVESPFRQALTVHFLNTGVPHAVVFLDSPDALESTDVLQLGRALRRHEHFAPAGTNVNFVAVTGKNSLRIRTYERGVEAETLACGTGVVASALLHQKSTNSQDAVQVQVRGGDIMQVRFARTAAGDFREVFLRGPADVTFRGEAWL